MRSQRDRRRPELGNARPATRQGVEPAIRSISEALAARRTDPSPTPAGGLQALSDAPRPTPSRSTAPVPALGPAPRDAAGGGLLLGTAADLVAALWCGASPAAWASEEHPFTAAADVRAALGRMSTDAEVLAIRAPAAERPSARLLAETARAAHAALDTSLPSLGGAISGSGTLPSSVRLRLARMEQWLSIRATTDPNAEPSANLCLWVLDQLEGDLR